MGNGVWLAWLSQEKCRDIWLVKVLCRTCYSDLAPTLYEGSAPSPLSLACRASKANARRTARCLCWSSTVLRAVEGGMRLRSTEPALTDPQILTQGREPRSDLQSQNFLAVPNWGQTEWERKEAFALLSLLPPHEGGKQGPWPQPARSKVTVGRNKLQMTSPPNSVRISAWLTNLYRWSTVS